MLVALRDEREMRRGCVDASLFRGVAGRDGLGGPLLEEQFETGLAEEKARMSFFEWIGSNWHQCLWIVLKNVELQARMREIFVVVRSFCKASSFSIKNKKGVLTLIEERIAKNLADSSTSPAW